MWSVKDGADQQDADVGALSENTGARVSWQHDQIGTYWVTIVAMDGQGGSAMFQFTITIKDY